ncbi:hypothetical protein EKH77_08970 [Streptomyces luteoverticillatus]|uniref:Uncharacterized protein n=1 Tax=Streptomyces luteoverticillatus TaxID=66425 RepID=A0A3S9PG65_STRLT|nr:hypothetical protein [Streptomyces luteoverticillatus]AZQ71327.1 hypothetical protein EKH77_08970 [Streptomyces luteoverticillatus]
MALAGFIGTASVIAGGYTFAVAAPAPAPTDEAAPPTAVETFSYPNADKILKEKGIVLRKGDGHILLADCKTSTDIVVGTRQNAEGRYCFKVTGNGKSGYLALEIPETFNIKTADYAVRAKVTAEGTTDTVDVPKNGFKGVGEGKPATEGGPGAPTVLVELRVTG